MAAWAEAEASHTAFKLIQGTVSAVSRHGVAVEQARGEQTASDEMYLPFAPQLKLQGVQSAAEIHPGDTVLVEYQETLLKDEAGASTKSSRVAVRVALVSRAPAPLPSQDEENEDATESTTP